MESRRRLVAKPVCAECVLRADGVLGTEDAAGRLRAYPGEADAAHETDGLRRHTYRRSCDCPCREARPRPRPRQWVRNTAGRERQ